MSAVDERTCDGQCCAVFTLKTPVEEHYREQIVDMAVPLTREEASARRVKFGGDLLPDPIEESVWSYFTCRHWDEETRLCGIYEDRPTMCREFPYDGKCENPGCTHCPSEEVVEKWRELRAREAAKAEEEVA